MFLTMLVFAAVVAYTLLGTTRPAATCTRSAATSRRRAGSESTSPGVTYRHGRLAVRRRGGMLLVARLTMGNPNGGIGYELQAIAAAVVGGASLFGGRGTIGGCFIGALLFTTIGNGANLLGVRLVLANGDRGPADRRRRLSRQSAEAQGAGAVGIPFPGEWLRPTARSTSPIIRRFAPSSPRKWGRRDCGALRGGTARPRRSQ